MDVETVRSKSQIADAAMLIRGLVETNKAQYSDDLTTIEKYYQGSWFFKDEPEVPEEYRPPHGDVLVAYLNGAPAGTVAIHPMATTISN